MNKLPTRKVIGMAYTFEDIKDSVTVVTGGAQGIGYSIASLFAEQGSKVVILDVNEDALSNARSELSEKGFSVLTKKCDIVNYPEVEKVFQEIVDELDKVDCLINNAGITKDGLFIRMKPEDWKKVVDVNLTGTFNCSRAVINHMRKSKQGSIINISSTSSVGNPGQASYAASKSGVIGFTASLGKEVARMGIRVNAIAPGFVETDMTQGLSEKVLQNAVSITPIGRLAKPVEVAKVALFLSSDLASFVTAKTYFVDGGLL